MDSAIKLIAHRKTEVDVIATEITSSAPVLATTQDTIPSNSTNKSEETKIPTIHTPVKPVERKLGSQLPKGDMTVSQYKSWLMQQLSMVNNFNKTDILKFD